MSFFSSLLGGIGSVLGLTKQAKQIFAPAAAPAPAPVAPASSGAPTPSLTYNVTQPAPNYGYSPPGAGFAAGNRWDESGMTEVGGRRVMGMAGGMARGGMGRLGAGIAGVLGRARAFTGKAMTSKKIMGLIRTFGWQAAATMTGLTLVELMDLWSAKSRRSRIRFTSRDKSRAKKYIRMLARCSADYTALRGRSSYTKRRRKVC